MALEALISLMGIGPNPPCRSSHGLFQISFHPSANILAILLGAGGALPGYFGVPNPRDWVRGSFLC
eukprot:10726193-Heterocapsa_arctica.AAC.1